MLRVGVWVEALESFGCALIEVGHDEDSGPMKDSIGTDDLEVLRLSVGEEIDRHTGDGQVEAVGVALPVDQIVLVRLIRKREEIIGHVGIAFVEGFASLRAPGEEDEVFGDIEESGRGKGDDECGEDSNAESVAGMSGFFDQPEHGDGREEEDWDLGADGAERMRESFVGQELRRQHGEEGAEEEEIDDKAKIPVSEAKTAIKQMECLPEQYEESGEEESADDRIEYRIRRVVVPPVLIAEEVVFDERDRESLGHGAPESAVIDFGGKHGDMRRAGFEILGMRDEEMIEHRRCGDHSTEDEGEAVFPEALEETLVGEYERREQDDEDERRDAEGDIGMESETEDQS